MSPRRKVDKACLRCRRRKEKCDARQPTCSPCHGANSECIYTWQQKKRGLPEGWVHTLEKLLALALAKYPDLEQCLLDSVSNGVTKGHQGFAALWTDQDHVLGLRKRWRNSVLANQLEGLIRDLEQMKPLKLDSLQDPEMVDFVKGDSSLPQIGNTTDKCLTEYGPVPLNLLELLERYFMFLHGWMPIFEKAYIYRLASKIHGSWGELSEPELCCIFAILSNVGLINGARQVHKGTCDYTGLALQLIPRISRDLVYQHVQSLVLLALASLQSGDFEDAWLLLGSACRTHLVVSQQQEVHEADSKARIHHGCFILDALLSSRLRLPPHLDAEDWERVSYTLSTDGLEEWSPANHYFKACLHSCPSRINSSLNLLFDVIHMFRSVSKTSSVEETDVLRQRLQNYRRPYPNPLGGKIQPPALPNQITTHLVYLAAILKTHEAIDMPIDLHFDITNSLLPLREYVRSVVQPPHIPTIWEPTFSVLLDLLQARFANGDNASQSSIDAIIVVVAELDDNPIFTKLKTRCSVLATTVSAGNNEHDTGVRSAHQVYEQSLQQIDDPGARDDYVDIAALEQQAMSLVTTSALDAEVDWDTTLMNLGFANGENINGLEMMTPDVFFQ